jgi:hypothetical protein
VGTFRLNQRGLVVYGDVVEGSVSAGERLPIPLNSSLSIAATIASIDAVDGTATQSHVALLVSADDDLEMSVIEGLNFIGETLQIGKAERVE